jgi:diguanylate cyclase (GGDEF)-like protein
MIVLGRLANMEATVQSTLLNEVIRNDMRSAELLSLTAQDMQAINGGVYRLFSLNAAHATDIDTNLVITSLATRIGAMQERLRTLSKDRLIPQHAAVIARVQAELGIYQEGILHAGFVMSSDLPEAVSSVKPFDVVSRRAAFDLSQLADDAVYDGERAAAASQNHVRRLHTLISALTLTICAFVAVFAWEITRRTAHSVRRIARATLLVAKGDAGVDISTLARGDELGGIVESLRSFQKNNERMVFLAHHDALTSLPNRVLLHTRIELALQDSARGRHCAVHCLDLDHFKAVNDTLGHPIGDGLLQIVARRLASCVRQGDTVARLGGDEFAIVQCGVQAGAGGLQDAAELAQRVIDRISQPYEVDGHQIIIGASVGVALTPCDDETVDTLMRNGDMALYRAKTEGRSTWRVFEPDMDAALAQRRVLELDMRAALAGQQFELYYQPLVNVRSREVSGFEALIRWHHPQRGMISPAEFIPLSEQTGLIVQIGAWVLQQACRDAAKWKGELKVAVNLSPLQLKDRNLLRVVEGALADAGLPGRRLELEITEGVLLQDNETTLATLHQLRNLGVHISMDDFGTGYSSLSYLRSFPFDKIKIDQSFIRDLAEHTGSAAIVRAVTGLGSSLGIHTTAEGVETEEQLAQLIMEGCTEVQGYLFSPPRPAHEVSQLVESISRARAISLVPVIIDSRAASAKMDARIS